MNDNTGAGITRGEGTCADGRETKWHVQHLVFSAQHRIALNATVDEFPPHEFKRWKIKGCRLADV